MQSIAWANQCLAEPEKKKKPYFGYNPSKILLSTFRFGTLPIINVDNNA